VHLLEIGVHASGIGQFVGAADKFRLKRIIFQAIDEKLLALLP
jgi:hypothetical protein